MTETNHQPLLPFKNCFGGLPWWPGGSDFTFQCRGCGFDPLVTELGSHSLLARKPKDRTEVIL